LADTIEAIIGALFLDQGLKPVYEFIKEHIIAEIPKKLSKPLKDAKSRLQEYIQGVGKSKSTAEQKAAENALSSL